VKTLAVWLRPSIFAPLTTVCARVATVRTALLSVTIGTLLLAPHVAPVSSGVVDIANMPPRTAVDLGPYACVTMPGDQPCEGIFDFSGMVYDVARHKIYVFGGGHATTFRDDVDVFDFATQKWTPAYAPTACEKMQVAADMDVDKGVWRATGHPFARHSYSFGVMANGEYVLPMTITFPGGCAKALRDYTGSLHARVPHYNPDTMTWRISSAEAPSSFAWMGGAAYDSISRKILIVGSYDVHIYDPITFATEKIFNYFHSGIVGTLIAHASGKFYYVGGCCPSPPEPVKVWEIVLDRKDFTRSTIMLLTTKGTLPTTTERGYAYDPDHDLIGTYDEGQFYGFHIGTRTWKSEAMRLPARPGLVLRNDQAHHAIVYDIRDHAFIFMASNRAVNYPLHTFAYKWGAGATATNTSTGRQARSTGQR
jgi:hypothetical protein